MKRAALVWVSASARPVRSFETRLPTPVCSVVNRMERAPIMYLSVYSPRIQNGRIYIRGQSPIIPQSGQRPKLQCGEFYYIWAFFIMLASPSWIELSVFFKFNSVLCYRFDTTCMFSISQLIPPHLNDNFLSLMFDSFFSVFSFFVLDSRDAFSVTFCPAIFLAIVEHAREKINNKW